jgi:hypothetical protein
VSVLRCNRAATGFAATELQQASSSEAFARLRHLAMLQQSCNRAATELQVPGYAACGTCRAACACACRYLQSSQVPAELCRMRHAAEASNLMTPIPAYFSICQHMSAFPAACRRVVGVLFCMRMRHRALLQLCCSSVAACVGVLFCMRMRQGGCGACTCGRVGVLLQLCERHGLRHLCLESLDQR